jgi:hypothetical protein
MKKAPHPSLAASGSLCYDARVRNPLMSAWLSPLSIASNRGRWPRLLALPVFGVALTLYGLTLSPSVTALFDDSLEFQLVTYQLGIAHPTGYPLYTLLGWLFTRLPIGDVAYRVNLMSAVFGALAVTLVYLIGLEIASNGERRPWSAVPAAAIGALALAVSPVFWSQTTLAEVYTLNSAFVAGMLLLLARGIRRAKGLMALAFLFGLSLTHHRTTVLLLPAIAFYLWRAAKSGSMRLAPTRKTAVKSAALLMAPLLLYLYLPLRGQVGSLDGTYTNTLAGFWQQVTAGGYGTFIFANPFGTERGADFYFTLFLQQFGWVGLGAGLAGLWALHRRDMQAVTGITFVSYLAFNLFYRVADIQVFFIPLFIIWALWIGSCAGWLLNRLGVWRGEELTVEHAQGAEKTDKALRSRRPQRLIGSALWVGVIVLFAGQSALLFRDNLPQLNRSGDWAVHDYGLDILHQPLEQGAAIVGLLGETTLVRYFQATERLRPDLLPVAADREADRIAAIARLLNEGRPVYLTRELAGAPARWSLSAAGPLIRVNPQPVRAAPETPMSIDAPLTPEITLHGYALSRPPAHGTPPLRLTLTWQVTASLARDLKVSARLFDTAGRPVAQSDAVPVHFAYPTTAWRPGEFIADVYDLGLPAGLPPGEYTPLLILYDPAQGAVEVGRLELAAVALP